jgi:type III secretory pathway component EscV
MKKHFETITLALAQIMQGESAPSFKSNEFTDLVGSIRALVNPSHISEPYTRLVHEQIGLKALLLLLEYMGSSMQSERALSMMRDKGEKPC